MQSWGPLPFGEFLKASPAGNERHGVSEPAPGSAQPVVILPFSFPLCLEKEQSEALILRRNILVTTDVVEKRASIVFLILLSICFTYTINWNCLIGLLPLSSLTCHEIFQRETIQEVKNKWNAHNTTALNGRVLKLPRQRQWNANSLICKDTKLFQEK